MVEMKIRGVTPKDAPAYIEKDIIRYKSLFGGLVDFKELTTTVVYLKNKDIVPTRYPAFYQDDFYAELKKYRLDYIVSSEKLKDGIIQQLPSLEPIKVINSFYIYRLP